MSLTVIYDKAYGGHHMEHIRRVFNYLNNQQDSSKKYVFVVHQKTAQWFSKIAFNKNIIFHCLTEQEQQIIIETKNPLKRGDVEWQLIKTKISNTIDAIIFLDMDEYQYLIGTSQFISTNIKTYGILFAPFYRINHSVGFFNRIIKNIFQKFRKSLQLKWMLKNKNIRGVFIFNDSECVTSFNTKFKTDVFKSLPDPVSDTVPIEKEEQFYEKYNINVFRKTILTFGAISDRKNIVNIIKAIQFLPKTLSENYQLLICGKCSDSNLETQIFDAIDEIKVKNPLFKTEFINSFLTELEVEEVLSVCDIVAIPYKDFFVSSGIIGHAAKYSKKMIVASDGLMGELINKYNIGFSCNPYKPQSIAEAISKSDKELIEDKYFIKYVTDNTTIDFCKVLLKDVI